MDEKIEIKEEVVETEAAEPEIEVIEVMEAAEASEDTEADDDFLCGGAENEKLMGDYDTAVRAIVFGALSVVLPLFGLILFVLGSYMLAAAVSVAGLIFGILGFGAAKKTVAFDETLTAGFAKNGRILSIIGLAVSAAVLAYVAVNFIITVIAVAVMLVVYIIYFTLMIIAMAMGMPMN